MTSCNSATAIAPTTALGGLVKARREARDLSITEASAAAGMDRATWWRIETGRSMPTIDSAHKIADVLGVSLDELFEHASDGSGSPNGAPETEPTRPRHLQGRVRPGQQKAG